MTLPHLSLSQKNTLLYSPNGNLADPVFQEAASLLVQGEVIAFPTETVYGLGAALESEEAIQKIFTLKRRPRSKGLLVHLEKANEISKVAEEVPEDFYLLAQLFLPGPLTIIVRKKKGLSSWISEGETIGVRVSAHRVTQRLIHCVGMPIVGTSANISGEPSPVSAQEVFSTFEGKIAAVVDGGVCSEGIPSTIVDITGTSPLLVREGPISHVQLQMALQKEVRAILYP